jgi:nucleoside triphosphate diphosphatase
MPPLERAVKLLERLEERGDAATVVASVVADVQGDVVASDGPDAGAADAGSGTVDRSWGAALLASVAAARDAGVDPIASLRAAVADLETAGRTGD